MKPQISVDNKPESLNQISVFDLQGRGEFMQKHESRRREEVNMLDMITDFWCAPRNLNNTLVLLGLGLAVVTALMAVHLISNDSHRQFSRFGSLRHCQLRCAWLFFSAAVKDPGTAQEHWSSNTRAPFATLPRSE